MPGRYSHSVVLAHYSSKGLINLPNGQHLAYVNSSPAASRRTVASTKSQPRSLPASESRSRSATFRSGDRGGRRNSKSPWRSNGDASSQRIVIDVTRDFEDEGVDLGSSRSPVHELEALPARNITPTIKGHVRQTSETFPQKAKAEQRERPQTALYTGTSKFEDDSDYIDNLARTRNQTPDKKKSTLPPRLDSLARRHDSPHLNSSTRMYHQSQSSGGGGSSTYGSASSQSQSPKVSRAEMQPRSIRAPFWREASQSTQQYDPILEDLNFDDFSDVHEPAAVVPPVIRAPGAATSLRQVQSEIRPFAERSRKQIPKDSETYSNSQDSSRLSSLSSLSSFGFGTPSLEPAKSVRSTGHTRQRSASNPTTIRPPPRLPVDSSTASSDFLEDEAAEMSLMEAMAGGVRGQPHPPAAHAGDDSDTRSEVSSVAPPPIAKYKPRAVISSPLAQIEPVKKEDSLRKSRDAQDHNQSVDTKHKLRKRNDDIYGADMDRSLPKKSGLFNKLRGRK